MEKGDKIERTLDIYSKLMAGYTVNKAEMAAKYNVNERSITRDLDDIRAYLDNQSAESGYTGNIVYDRIEKGYRFKQLYQMRLSDSEVLAICKILLDSRAFTKRQMGEVIDKLIENCVPKSHRKSVSELIKNEEYHYVELTHKTDFLRNLWEIGQAILSHNYIEIGYKRPDKKELTKRKIKPLAIMFNEFYFYLAAIIEDKELNEFYDLEHSLPTIYRIDRIKKLKVKEEKFRVPYQNRFEEGEFRKRMQFMYGGPLSKIQFDFKGASCEHILDRLPTAKVIKEVNGVFTIAAEVYGTGFEMWLSSQGDAIKNIVVR